MCHIEKDTYVDKLVGSLENFAKILKRTDLSIPNQLAEIPSNMGSGISSIGVFQLVLGRTIAFNQSLSILTGPFPWPKIVKPWLESISPLLGSN